MKKCKRLLKKAVALVLALTVLMAVMPSFGLFSASAAEVDRVTDPATMHSWRDFFGSQKLDTTYAGGVWTDKSVFTTDATTLNNAFGTLTNANGQTVTLDIKDAQNNFLVALSALASNKSITGYSHIPTDTILILDVSNSMNPNDNDAVLDMVTATNAAITKLLAVNNYNRVGVVLYSSSSNFSGNNASATLLPLSRYSATNTTTYNGGTPNNTADDEVIGVYLETNPVTSGWNQHNGDKISIAAGVKDVNKNNATVNRVTYDVTGGTFIQSGIDRAMDMLLAVEDTTIEGDGFQAGTARLPVMVLMSDGEPTYATTNYTNVSTTNVGSGGSANDLTVFLTQLTAAYAKQRVADHYERGDALFYTLGLGVGNNDYAESVLDPRSSYNAIDTLWDTYLGADAGDNVNIGSRNNPVTVVRNNTITAENYIYANDYFLAESNADLYDAFDSIVSQIIIQSLYYPTLVTNDNHHLGGYIQFTDDIGEYMEVKAIQGLELGGVLFTGELLAQNFTPNGGSLGTVENPNEMGDAMVWAVMERLGISSLPQFDTYEKQVQEARNLISLAYQHGQLSYSRSQGKVTFSNYIGWYADANGNYLGFWDSTHTAEEAPAGAAYVNKSYGMLGEVVDGHRQSDMMYISIQVHTEIATGHQSMLYRIPASLIPVISYEIIAEGQSMEEVEQKNNIKVTIDDAAPLRLLFEVGLRSDINPINIAEKLSTEYKEATDAQGNRIHVSPEGGYYLYTNQWSVEQYNDPTLNPTENVNTGSYFEPSVENERYYYTEDTDVYYRGVGGWVKYDGPSTPVQTVDNSYQRAYKVFHIINAATGEAEIRTLYEPISAASLSKAQRDASGVWYIPKGTIHRYTEEGVVANKDPNHTQTLPIVAHPDVEAHIDTDLTDGDSSYYYAEAQLGNNGRLTVIPATGIVVSKAVDETVTDTNATFSFTLSGAADGEYETMLVDANGNETGDTIEVDGGTADFTLKAGERFYIVGLATGTYTVTENVSGTDYDVKTINGIAGINSVELNVTERNIIQAAFVNTARQPGDVIIGKTVTHPYGADYQIPDTIKFAFKVEVFNGTNPAVLNNIVTSKAGLTASTDGNGQLIFNDGNSTELYLYLAPGERVALYDILDGYTVKVTEVNIPNGFTAVQPMQEKEVDGFTVFNFTNDYQAGKVNDVNVTVDGVKDLKGREWISSDEFTFVLQEYDRTAGAWKTLGNATADYNNHNFSFSSLIQAKEYTHVGTYHYRISEVWDANSAIGGITYDRTIHYFNIVVTDEHMDGMLEISQVTDENQAEVPFVNNTWDVDVAFNNRYAPLGDDVITINIQKDVTTAAGVDFAGKYGLAGFQFGLYQNGVLVGEALTAADGTAQIKMVYSALDCGSTYEYTLREIAGNNTTITYTDATYDIEVYVHDDDYDGYIEALVFAKTADSSIPATAGEAFNAQFTNTYDPADAGLTISGTKTLTGGKTLGDGDYTFKLYNATFNNGVFTKDGNAIQSVPNVGGTFAFTGIPYTVANTYYYIVEEDASADTQSDGIIYDTTQYGITVVVEDNGDYTLVATVTPDNSLVTVQNGTAATASLPFTNAYKAVTGTSVTVNVQKDIDDVDGTGIGLDGFKFAVYEADGVTLVAQSNVTGTDGKASITIPVSADDAGQTLDYILKEVAGNVHGMQYDTNGYALKVKVTDNYDGSVSAVVYEAASGEATATATVEKTITNIYDLGNASLVIKGKKILDGNKTLQGNDFTFKLYEATFDGTSFIKKNTTPQSVQNAADGTFTFPTALSFGKVDTYYYIIEEDATNDTANDGIKYDDTVYYLTVTVTGGTGGQLVVSNVTANVSSIITNLGSNVWEVVAAFNNEYKPVVGTNVTVNVQKDMDDPDNTGIGLDGFTFGIYKADGVTLVAQSNVTGTDGKASITIPVAATDAGNTLDYILKEIPGTKPGMQYNTNPIALKVKVTDNLDGTVSAVIYDAAAQPGTATSISKTIKNTYDLDSAQLNIRGTKVLEGNKPLAAGDYTFNLYKADGRFQKVGAALQTAQNALGGSITFADALVFDTVDTYYFIVEEDTSADVDGDGLTYDKTVYQLTVKVADGGNGKLVVQSISSNYASIVTNTNNVWDVNALFTNRYAAEQGTQVTIQLQKNVTDLVGSNYGKAGFKFGLYKGTTLVAESTVTDENGLATITLDVAAADAGETLDYILKEIDTGVPGMKYDITEYPVYVKVTDNLDGTVSAVIYEATEQNATGTISKVINNTYDPDDAKLAISGKKVLNGKPLEIDEFVFQLYGAKLEGEVYVIDGTMLQSTKNLANGTFTFAELSFDKIGTYYYIVKEDASAKALGITYDENLYVVAIEVTDGGQGKLVATVKAVTKTDGTALEALQVTNTYTAPVEPEEPPKTGDTVNILLWAAVLFVSGILAVGTRLRRKAQN